MMSNQWDWVRLGGRNWREEKSEFDRHSDERKNHRQLLDDAALAFRWGVSLKLISQLRAERDGPPITWVGNTIRYHVKDIREFERKHNIKKSSAWYARRRR